MTPDQLIKELASKYKLSQSDYWKHTQSGSWIIKHHALQTIFHSEGLTFPAPAPGECWGGDNFHRHIQRCFRSGEEMGWAYGEANQKTCAIGYFGIMAQYRGIALSGKRAMGWGGKIYSDQEADSFSKKAAKAKPKPAPRPKPVPLPPLSDDAASEDIDWMQDTSKPVPEQYKGGGARPAGTKFPKFAHDTYEKIKTSIMAGDEPAFNEEMMSRWPYRAGSTYPGKTWLEAFVAHYGQLQNYNHINGQIQGMKRQWDDGEDFSEWMMKKLHTFLWIRFRINPSTGGVVPLADVAWPDSWGSMNG